MGSSVLLVHGAYHGGWCWDAVQRGLAEREIRSRAPDLPLTGFGNDVDALRSVVVDLRRSGPVTLVAHSYAGIVAAAAGHQADRLIFVAARLPLPCESQAALTPRWNVHPGLHAATTTDPDGWSRVEAAAQRVFYPDCAPDVAAAAMARLRPMRSAVPADPVDPPAWTHLPSAYVVCARDAVVRVDRQRERAALADHHYELDSGHSPFLSVPEALTRILAEQAGLTTALSEGSPTTTHE